MNTATSLLITAALTLAAFAATRPLVNLHPAASTNAVPAATAVVLIALFVMVTRRHAVSQAAGFLMLDNGIAATAFLLTAGVPLIVELGASLDVLFAVIVIGVLTGRLRAHLRRRRPGRAAGAARLMTGLLLAAILAPIGASVATAVGRVAPGDRDADRAVGADGARLRRGAGVRVSGADPVRVGRAAARRRARRHHADRHRNRSRTLATWASIGYLDAELAHGHTDAAAPGCTGR